MTETGTCHRGSPDLPCYSQEGQLCETEGASRQRYREETREDRVLP